MRSSEHWRVFAAIELTPEVRSQLREHIQSLQESVPEAQPSWTRVDNIHITLKFFGDVAIDRVADIGGAAARAASNVRGFEIAIEGTGAFPKPKQPKVLWVGVNDRSGKLAELQRAFENECAAEGFPKEERNFRPHLTIARIRKPTGASELGEANQLAGFQARSLLVNEIVIFRSQLSSKGSVYTVLTRHKLMVLDKR